MTAEQRKAQHGYDAFAKQAAAMSRALTQQQEAREASANATEAAALAMAKLHACLPLTPEEAALVNSH